MRRYLAPAMALFLCAVGAASQTMTVSGSNIVDSTGAPLVSGTIAFAPVDLSGNPLGYRMGGRGQTLDLPVTATVTDGAFTITLPDTSATNPVNVCFAVTVADNVTGASVLGKGYRCVQPSSTGGGWCGATTCNFDNYVPNTPGLPIETLTGGGGGTFTGGTVTGATTFQATATVNADGGANAAAILSARQLHTPTVSGGRAVPIDQLCPNLAAGYGCASRLGVDGATNDFASLVFNYTAPGSASNSVDLGFPAQNGGAGGVLPVRVWASGDVTIGNTADPGKLIGIGSANQFWVDQAGNASAQTLLLGADPTSNLQAATKQYVDNHVGGAPATDHSLGAVQLAAGQTATELAKVATTGDAADLSGLSEVNVGTANALATSPVQCPSGQVPTGIAANGDAEGCSSATAGTFTGGTVTGPTTFASTVALSADPSSALQAATKQYVDYRNNSVLARYTLYVSGGTTYALNNSTTHIDYSNTDAAVVINDVLATMVNTGGTLFFKNGTYNLNSCTMETDSAYTTVCYAVGIPSVGDGATYPTFRFQGEGWTITHMSSQPGVDFNLTTAAETAAGSNTLAAFWMRPSAKCMGGGTGSCGLYWNAATIFDNLDCTLPNNTRGNELCFDMIESSYFSLSHSAEEFATSPTALGASGDIAIRGPGTPSMGTHIEDINVQPGWDVGIEVNAEHSVLINTEVYEATTGYEYGQTLSKSGSPIYHSSQWIHAQIYDCVKGITAGAHIKPGAQLDIVGLDDEYINSGNWAQTYAFHTTANLGGFMSWGTILTSVGTENALSTPFDSGSGANYVVERNGLLNSMGFGQQQGTSGYHCVNLLGAGCTAFSGSLADVSGTDPALYLISNLGMVKVKNGATDNAWFAPGNHTEGNHCGGHHFTFYQGDGYETWCNGTTEVDIAHP